MYLIIFQCISFATDGWENRGNCLQNSRKIFASSFPFPNTRDFIIEMQKHLIIFQCISFATDGWENRGNCLQNSRKIFASSFPFPNTRDFIIEMQKHFQIKQIFALSNNYTIRKRVTNQK